MVTAKCHGIYVPQTTCRWHALHVRGNGLEQMGPEFIGEWQNILSINWFHRWDYTENRTANDYSSNRWDTFLTGRAKCNCTLIERFHSRDYRPYWFTETKESICIKIEFNSQRFSLGHQHGRHFFVLGHQHVRRDVMWKHSIAFVDVHVYVSYVPPVGAKELPSILFVTAQDSFVLLILAICKMCDWYKSIKWPGLSLVSD